MADKIITLAELLKMLDKYNHKELHVHHTWRPDHETYFKKPDPLYWQAAMRRYHKETNGWSDIGQHVTLLPDGRFVTGRDFSRDPASIKGYNTKAFAVEMIGDFDIGKDVLEGKQRESIIELARWFDKRGRYIRFHRENSTKTCPGSGIDKAEFMAEVRGEKKEGGDYPLFDRVLKHGMSGKDVKLAQRLLTAMGHYTGPIDGKFGPGQGFLNAVKDFQRDNGLEVDGKIGPQTQAKMLEIMLQRVEQPIEDTNALQAEVSSLKNRIRKYEDYFRLQNELSKGV